MATPEWTLRDAVWAQDVSALMEVRMDVFVHEQGVPVELERDADDERALHVLAQWKNGAAVGTGRLTANGHVGRMAVRKGFRGLGIGSAILERLMARASAELGLHEVFLNAQVHALGFYARQGFTAEGPVFDDAGIPHRRMKRSI